MLSFIPDVTMVKLQYRIKTGRHLYLNRPKRFTEKLQYYKLFYRNPIMKQCVDKYEVREYIKRNKLSTILNECYGVYNEPSEVNFDKLPSSFVLKDTLGGGGNSVIIIKDKSKVNKEALSKQMESWVKSRIDVKHPGREWVYDGMKHRIIVERYIESDSNTGGLIDYKFFCLYGEVKFLYVVADRKIGAKAGFGIFDPDFKMLDVCRADEKPLERKIEKPENYAEMLRIANILSRPFPEARIDLYDEKGKILFGEITFFDGSGYMTFEPDEYDEILGDMFEFKKDELWVK